MSRTHLNAVRIHTEERGYIALYNAIGKPFDFGFEQCFFYVLELGLTRTKLLHKVKIIL